eukprot:UN00635
MSGLVPAGYECCTRMGFYCWHPSNSAFWLGCLAYAIFGIIAAIVCCFAFGTRNRAVAVHSAIIGTVCLWIMWAMTWLSQWHPLVYPQYSPEEDESGNAYNGTYVDCLNTTTVDTIYWLGDGSTTS